MWIGVFVNSYQRGRSYFTYGAGSSTDCLQAWAGVLWNVGLRRKLPRCETFRDSKPYSDSSPERHTLSPFLVWPGNGCFNRVARDYSQQQEDGPQLGNSIRSRSRADRRRSWPASNLR